MLISEVIEQRKQSANASDITKLLAKVIDEQVTLEGLSHRSDLDISTPAALVNEMLDKLFENLTIRPDLTFLDPACGRGTFLRELRKRLLTNQVLIAAYPLLAERDEHIRKHMLYGFEIETAMVNVLQLQGYGNVQFQDALAYTGDTMKFDVVIGNPPYQMLGSKNAIYPRFHNLAILLAKRYTMLVTPKAIVNGMSEGKNCDKIKLSPTNVMYINIDCSSYFPGIGSSFLYYLAKPATTWPKDILVGSTRAPLANLPLNLSDPSAIAVSIINKCFSYRKNYYNGTTSDCRQPEDPNGKFKALKSIDSSGEPIYVTISRQPSQCKVFGKPKLLVPILGKKSMVASGDIVPSSDHLVSSFLAGSVAECKTLDSILRTSKLPAFLAHASGDSRSIYDNFLRSFKRLDLTRNWTDEEIYAHFNLTAEEIAYIEETVK